MIDFNAGAWRQAALALGDDRLGDANALVQRTLAQHGLVNGSVDAKIRGSRFVWPDMKTLSRPWVLDRALGNVNARRPPCAPAPLHRYVCKAGARDYLIHIPSAAATRPKGFVVMLHGCTQTAQDFADGTAMNALADRDGFIVIYPQQARGDNIQTCWNWFNPSDQRRDGGEPAIIAGITQQIVEKYGSRDCPVFVAGLSAGAAMAVILGETYPELFSAVGAHSGLPYGAAYNVASAYAAMAGKRRDEPGQDSEASFVRTIVFHGSNDMTVHASNGEGIVRQARRRGSKQTIETEQKGFASDRSFRRRMTTSITGEVEIEHWLVDGLGHAWSGGLPVGSYTDNLGPAASDEMVRFFFQKK